MRTDEHRQMRRQRARADTHSYAQFVCQPHATAASAREQHRIMCTLRTPGHIIMTIII